MTMRAETLPVRTLFGGGKHFLAMRLFASGVGLESPEAVLHLGMRFTVEEIGQFATFSQRLLGRL